MFCKRKFLKKLSFTYLSREKYRQGPHLWAPHQRYCSICKPGTPRALIKVFLLMPSSWKILGYHSQDLHFSVSQDQSHSLPSGSGSLVSRTFFPSSVLVDLFKLCGHPRAVDIDTWQRHGNRLKIPKQKQVLTLHDCHVLDQKEEGVTKTLFYPGRLLKRFLSAWS